MKTNEFIKKVEELGFECLNQSSIITILHDGFGIYYVKKEMLYSFDSEVEYVYGTDMELIYELFELVCKYASTPLDEREEEVKYYLRQRPMLNTVFVDVLNYNLNIKKWQYHNRIGAKCTKTQFTEKEIEDLGHKLNDFAYCVVGTDEWLNTGIENE